MSKSNPYVDNDFLKISAKKATVEFSFSADGYLEIVIDQSSSQYSMGSTARIIIPKDRIEELAKFMNREVES